MKFQFNLQTHTLKLVKEDHSLVFSEPSQFRTLGGIGFSLDEWNGNEPPRCWILFKISGEKVRIVYKSFQDGSTVYYQRELIRPTSGIVEVEFSEWDRMKKQNHHA